MWAGGNYFSNPIPIKGFDIYHCLHLENIFIARSFCRIASTAFLRTQHGEIYIGLIEQAYKGLGNSLCPIVETSGTTNPKKNFWSFALGCVLSHSWYNYFFLEIIHYYAVFYLAEPFKKLLPSSEIILTSHGGSKMRLTLILYSGKD